MTRYLWVAGVVLGQALGAGFGTVVPIGGTASDLALDEARGVLYVANFTANRIEVLSTADNSVRTSFNVDQQPGALALSPDGQFLLVAHYPSPENRYPGALTVINLADNTRTRTLIDAPLGVAFTRDGRALVVTSTGFELFDPVSGAIQFVDSFANVSAALPAPLTTPLAQVIETAVAASADRTQIWGLASTSAGQIIYRYDVQANRIAMSRTLSATPPLQPRVSVSSDGLSAFLGHARFDAQGVVMAQYPDPTAQSGTLSLGGHALDSATNTLYAHIPDAYSRGLSSASSPFGPAGPVSTIGLPVLAILDADNLTVRERLLLPENLTGRAVLTAGGDIMYAISDSGITALPVGNRNQYHRVSISQEDAVVRSTFCNRNVVTLDLAVTDPGGGNTDFRIVNSTAGVSVSPAGGMTPAVVKIRVDPTAFQNQNGAVAIPLQIFSTTAISAPSTLRLLVNNRAPEQRGTPLNLPGTLTDILADPVRDRFYIVRQDKNQVLVFDGTSYQLIRTLRTATTPTRLAFSFDRKYLLIGHDNAQIALVYDLDSFEQQIPVVFPFGSYPRMLAASGAKVLAATRGEPAQSVTNGLSALIGPPTGTKSAIASVDLIAHRASLLPTLGIYTNAVSPATVLAPAPNGNLVLGAMPDGTVFLYNASADTFTASRKDSPALAGPFAASSYEQFVVGNTLLNSSLVPQATFETSSGFASGFAFVDQTGFRVTAPNAASPGVIQRVDPAKNTGSNATRMAEAPLLPAALPGMVFTRTIAPLANRTGIVTLTTSGFTVLSWNYDAATAPPRISKVVNAADQTQPVAPGGLISIFGSQMSPVSLSTREIPLPTALGESCLTVNGVPVPMIFVSGTQINGQLPFNVDGAATMLLRTPGGTSDNFYMSILPAAPRIFRTGTAGPQTGLPTVIRGLNSELVTLSNPIHPKDTITIYATGLGRTSPAIDAGLPAPADPLPQAVIQPEVTLGGTKLQIDYAGLVPGEVGVYQINATVPATVAQGMEMPLTVSQAGDSTTLSVRVVKP